MKNVPTGYPSDGATLPKFFRSWIEDNYDPEVIALIDRAGVYHDWLTLRYPNTASHNRRRFIKQLKRYGVPMHLVRIIHVGLWLFDHFPKKLQDYLQKKARS